MRRRDFCRAPYPQGFDKGLSLHCGKILECAGLSAILYDLAEPLLGRVRRDHFEVEPCHPAHRCTTVSVAGHSLYERGDPCLQPGPGGMNDLTDARFTQLDERRVTVTGSRFVPDQIYRVKLEGAEQVGFRSIVMVGIRDPIMIRQIDSILAEARARAEDRFKSAGGGIHLTYRIYGKNAVMGDLEPDTHLHSHEIGLMIDVVAPRRNWLPAWPCLCAEHCSTQAIRASSPPRAIWHTRFRRSASRRPGLSLRGLSPDAAGRSCEIFPMRSRK